MYPVVTRFASCVTLLLCPRCYPVYLRVNPCDPVVLPCPRTQVRVILRDLAGKFCWDASVLYGTDSQLESLCAGKPCPLLFTDYVPSRLTEQDVDSK